MGKTSTAKPTALQLQGDAAASAQRLSDVRTEWRRRTAVSSRQSGRLSLLGAPEAGRQAAMPIPGAPAAPVNPRMFVGGGPQPAAMAGI